MSALARRFMMIKLFNGKEDCCGCTACKSICPKHAIMMQPDEDGFLYPHINENLCIKCGLCKKVCPFENSSQIAEHLFDGKPIAAYAAIHNNMEILKSSSSGGVFPAVASIVLDNNGVVFGCTMYSNMEAEHISIDSINGIKKLQGSKYVQSNVKKTFQETENYLKEGRLVLYTGTPCQIAGLKSYLGKDYENLITIDLVCHGVPSPTFFKGYINWFEKKVNGRIVDFKFRNKSKIGMGCIGKAIYIKNGRIYKKAIIPSCNYYYQYFENGDIDRECCYRCKYASGDRPGDFTMGDYWGIENVHPKIDTQNGVSVLLVNSKKGMQLIGKINGFLKLTESSFEKARIYNGNLNHPTHMSDKRELIFKTFRESGAYAVDRMYRESVGKKMIWYRIKAMIPNSFKRRIKKLFGLLRHFQKFIRPLHDEEPQ